MDSNGILSVTAKDLGTNKEANIKITKYQGNLSQEEIEKMIEEAKKYEEEDKKLKRKIDARNSLESYASQVKSHIEDNQNIESKITPEEKTQVLDHVKSILSWIEQNPSAETEEYEQKKKELEQLVHPIISKIYEQNNDQSIPKHNEL